MYQEAPASCRLVPGLPQALLLGVYKLTAQQLFKFVCVVFHGQLKENRRREAFSIGTPQRSQRKSALSDPFFLAP